MCLSLVTDSPHLPTPTLPTHLQEKWPQLLQFSQFYPLPTTFWLLKYSMNAFCPDGSSLIMLASCPGPTSVMGGQFDIGKYPHGWLPLEPSSHHPWAWELVSFTSTCHRDHEMGSYPLPMASSQQKTHTLTGSWCPL